MAGMTAKQMHAEAAIREELANTPGNQQPPASNKYANISHLYLILYQEAIKFFFYIYVKKQEVLRE